MIISTLVLFLLQSEPEKNCKPCVPSDAGLQFISHFEGYSPFSYPDPVGINTIGFGHVIRKGEHFPMPLLPPDAYTLLKSDANIASGGVNRVVAISLRQCQFDALSDFQFNTGALRKSTLINKVNAKRHNDVPMELRRWVYAQGHKLTGLQKRREAEGEYYGCGK